MEGSISNKALDHANSLVDSSQGLVTEIASLGPEAAREVLGLLIKGLDFATTALREVEQKL